MHQPWSWSQVPAVAESPPRAGAAEWLMAGGMHAQGRVTGPGLTQQPLPRDFRCQSGSLHMAVTHGRVSKSSLVLLVVGL